MEGVIIKSTGSWYLVEIAKDNIVKARIRGKFRIYNMPLTNPVAVGDIVTVKKEEKSEAYQIIKFGKRKNYIIRQSSRRKHKLHILAANIDKALVFVTIKYPNLKPSFIDRFLLMTEPFDIPVTIVVNKKDLYGPKELELFEEIREVYEDIGYEVILISSIEDDKETFVELLKDNITLLSGHSGVGKSTFINRILPELGLKTLEISDFSGKGKHTTTFAQMYPLDFGGAVIDTPGIKSLSYNHLEIEDVRHNFREFFKLSRDCKFNNCTHRNEPNCAVKEALEAGEIYPNRYFSYLSILEDIEEQNYWERHTEF